MCHVMSKTLQLCWEHLNFRAVYEAAEELLRKAKKKCGDTEKNKEKIEANCTHTIQKCKKMTGQNTFKILLLNDAYMIGNKNEKAKYLFFWKIGNF